jgi:hypothetical protein
MAELSYLGTRLEGRPAHLEQFLRQIEQDKNAIAHKTARLLDPQEILDKIYQHYFKGIVLVQWSADNPHKNPEHHDAIGKSRLALLSLSKSQHQVIHQILMDHATFKFGCACHVAIIAMGSSRVNSMEHLVIDVNLPTTPFLLMSKALRKLPNLKSIRVNGRDLQPLAPILSTWENLCTLPWEEASAAEPKLKFVAP